MNKKKVLHIIILVVSFITGCKSAPYMDGFSPEDLKLELEIFGNKNSLEGKITCKNISNKRLRLPKFYLTFNDFNTQKMKNNWLSIHDEKGFQVEYHGDYHDPFFKSLKSDVVTLKPQDTYEINIYNIEMNYEIVPSTMLFITYLGPLGESNEVKYLVR